ncbi:MAG: sodium:glutamate symporter [Gracilibacteraceae bacterium]|jgi:ESS family glutamate:Na+ symporter|nr:sodium:glutamate symporter [Gracilibacteraceae bacterium]
MEIVVVGGLALIKVNMYQLAALGVVAYYIGIWARSRFGALVRFSIPAPVVGGLPFALLVAALEYNGVAKFSFDGTIQTILMLVFFCTIGMNASVSLVKKGTLLILAFFLMSVTGAVLQNIIGMGVASAFAIDPRLGIIGGSVTLTGGLGTAGAFGPVFESMGVKGAAAAGVACATFGMVAGSIVGGPMAEYLIRRKRLKTPQDPDYVPSENFAADTGAEDKNILPGDLMNNLAWVIFAVGAGSVLSYYVGDFFRSIGSKQTFPPYLGAMFVAIFIRNAGEISGIYKIESKVIDAISDISLSIFISMAIVSMKLAELIYLALPLLCMMFVQLALVLLMAYFMVYMLFGRDYEASVLSAGFIGFMMGATSNALVSMQAVTSKYGYAAKAYFVVPIVGAFLVDIPNAFLINYMGNAEWILNFFGLN